MSNNEVLEELEAFLKDCFEIGIMISKKTRKRLEFNIEKHNDYIDMMKNRCD